MGVNGVINIAVYDEAGSIARVISCSPSQARYQVGEGEMSVEVADGVADDTHYIRDGQAVEKAALSPSFEVDGFAATVTGLPAGLEVSFDGATTITDDDPLEIEVDEPGTCILRINGGAPYLDTEVEVTIG